RIGLVNGLAVYGPNTARIGLVNGLAVYGPNTGALLEIEVTAIKAKDKGSVNVTGIVEEESIGSQTKSIRRKSMAKGSVDNVLTVLRSLDVLPEGYDIHINFPGGIPIDGPSAGIARATGVYSAVHHTYVNNEVAMTGEISIHGEVKPIGGVYAKIKAAKKAGAKKVIIPAENMQPFLYTIKGIEIIPVRKLKEVFELTFMQENMHRELDIHTTIDETDAQSM
ncbi:magnesium chelatase domain-containing protein, partial [Vibrio parahaemolyticus]|nr:magnesium chelatase domain-containing protein [Vibrio parahaemolyticus]